MKIPQYCSVCKAEYEMSVVPTSDGDDDGVVWLQCPSCKGFLPKVSSSADLQAAAEEAPPPADGAEAPDAPTTEAPDAGGDDAGHDTPAAAETSAEEPPGPDPLADMDVSKAVPYRPWESYGEGDVIHHLAWDDYGVVVAKETLPGNRKVVQVRFADAGTVRLIEQEVEGS
jgi:hypothetical protein